MTKHSITKNTNNENNDSEVVNTPNPIINRKILPLLLSMSIPPMISMLIQSLYNIIDSIFVAQISQEALTAVSIAFPLQNLVLSFAVGLGVAVNANIAINMGAGNIEKADRYVGQGIFLTVIHALIFVFIGLFGLKPFFSIFTESAEVMNYAIQYGLIVITLSIGMLLHILFEKIFQANGNMMIPMFLQGFGAITNIILDPIFIFGLFGFPAMGVKGAAIATIIGQFSAALLSIILFIKKSPIKIKKHHFKPNKKLIFDLYKIALPSGMMMSMPSILTSIINGILASVSQASIAFFGIYYKLQTFVNMPVTGMIQGMRPIVSYNYGAGLQKRVLGTIKTALSFSAVMLIGGTVLFCAIPEQLLLMFNASNDLLRMGIPGLRILSLGFAFSFIGITMSGVFEALGKGLFSLIISIVRQLIIVVPLSIIFIKIIGLNGVWITFPIAEFIAAIMAIILYKKIISNKTGNTQ